MPGQLIRSLKKKIWHCQSEVRTVPYGTVPQQFFYQYTYVRAYCTFVNCFLKKPSWSNVCTFHTFVRYGTVLVPVNKNFFLSSTVLIAPERTPSDLLKKKWHQAKNITLWTILQRIQPKKITKRTKFKIVPMPWQTDGISTRMGTNP